MEIQVNVLIGYGDVTLRNSQCCHVGNVDGRE